MVRIIARLKKKIQRIYFQILPLRFHKKIFVISIQRSGTTSTGGFFRDFNYSVAPYSMSTRNQWSLYFLKGDYENIFNSKDFKIHQVFEDDPWWLEDFYKVLYHRFPNSKFILMTRNSEKWYNSMISHSNGKTLGNTYLHCKAYNRDFRSLNPESTDKIIHSAYSSDFDNLLDLDENNKTHYINQYELKNEEIKLFFKKHNSERLICLELEDDHKWVKLGKFFTISVPNDYNSYRNITGIHR